MIDRNRDREQDRDRQPPSDREQAILADVRKFRLIEPRHISPELRPELDRMLRQKTLYKHIVLDYKGRGRKLEILTTPTKDGSMPRLQKPREIYHDAAIYPAYRKAAAEIERGGGHIETVLNDFELKSIKARANNAAAPGRAANGPVDNREKEAIAAKLNLTVVNGRIYLPDLQIHYRDCENQQRVLNLEVTTDSYRGRDIAPKAAAGFAISRADGRAGAKIYDDHKGVWG